MYQLRKCVQTLLLAMHLQHALYVIQQKNFLNYSRRRIQLSNLHTDTQLKLCETELMLYQTVTGHHDLQGHTINSMIRSRRKSTQKSKLEELYVPDPTILLECLRNQKQTNYMRQDPYSTVLQGTF